MKNLQRNKIEEIALTILNNGDITAKHGTSIENAMSIINTGFNYHRTSYVMQNKKDINLLCGYGWKDNPPNDSTNVVIQVPRQFIMDLLSMTNLEEYSMWLENVINNYNCEDILKSFTTFEWFPEKKVGKFTTSPSFKAHIPQEFIVGAFIWCNGKTYLSLGEDESPLDNLNFVENERFYLNLSPEDRKEFVNRMREKLGIKTESKQHH